MSDDGDEFTTRALISAFFVGIITLFFSFIFLFPGATRIFREENALLPVERRGLFGSYIEDQPVTMADLGVATMFLQVVVPAVLFFLLYIVFARVAYSFCLISQRIFAAVANSDDEILPEGHEHLVIRVVFWPCYLALAALLLAGAFTLLLFKNVWR